MELDNSYSVQIIFKVLKFIAFFVSLLLSARFTLRFKLTVRLTVISATAAFLGNVLADFFLIQNIYASIGVNFLLPAIVFLVIYSNIIRGSSKLNVLYFIFAGVVLSGIIFILLSVILGFAIKLN